MDSSHLPIKVIPMMIDGGEGGCPHTFLVRLDTQSRRMEWLDSCTSNSAINAEREMRLHQLTNLLHGFYQWDTAGWAEWTGWEGGVPQQENDEDCMLLAWQFALALYSGAKKVDLVQKVTLRGLAVKHLVEQAFREPVKETAAGPSSASEGK
jgi:hypothetical protein